MWCIPSKRWGVWLTAMCRYARDFDNQREVTGRHPAPQFVDNFVPLEGYRVFKFNSSLLAIFLLSGCSSDLVLNPPKQPDYKPMPDITQSVTPTQQRAIMAGERPDWSERTPVSAAKRY